MKLFEDFLETSEDNEPGDEDEEVEENYLISKLATKLIVAN